MNSLFQGLSILGVASALPANKSVLQNNNSFFTQEELRRIAESTGINEKYTSSTLCTSDLCCAAADKLITSLEIAKETIDVLIFVSQTPDYILPATACSLQTRLSLAKSCAAFDVNLGCSGYVYGLWLAANILNSKAVRRVLLLAGDTISRVSSPYDRSVMPIFSDAGTATLIERKNDCYDEWFFCLGTNGLGEKNLLIPAGGFRKPFTTEALKCKESNDGNIRSELNLYMNGTEIFSFTLDEVPKLVQQLLTFARWSIAEVGAFIFHQANRFILNHLRKKIGIPLENFLMNIEQFGNTSSASIPLVISSEMSKNPDKYHKVVFVGFGVGYSWAACSLNINSNICLPPVVYIE